MFDDAVIERAARFACAADEVWRLQRGAEADCVLFQRWSNGGERITDRGSRQGFWVFAPGGALLGRINSRSPVRVAEMLDTAWERWEALDPAERAPSADVPKGVAHRWEAGYPEGGLALERFSRDVAADGLAAEPSDRWNRDTLWCSRDEVRAMLATDAAPGDSIELELLADRLARFSLVDDARGQTLPFAPEEVRAARLTARVTSREDDVVELTLDGATEALGGDAWTLGDNSWRPKRVFPRAMRTTLAGTATVDLAASRFLAFDLVALGVRSGRTVFNGRARMLEPSPVGFHLSLAPDRLAPTFASLYGVDWMPRPDVPTWRDSIDEPRARSADR